VIGASPDDPFGDDLFGTAAIRGRVLDAWMASPARFREDANAEEDLALGAYRDRVVVELAQNAADAAARAGMPGRLLLRLVGGDAPALVAANTGAPLDAAGVEALATLRASSKRNGATVGRFGVGFAAVLGVTDAPAVLGPAGGVGFSRAGTRAAVEAVPALAEELAARAGHVPALRLPFPAAGEVPAGYHTAVVLPLRDAEAVSVVRAQLDAVDDALLLALPGLAEITVELPERPPAVLADVGRRWWTLRRSGELDPALLSDRPTEERQRPGWTLTWALPRDPAAAPPPVLHAPTPSDEPLTWPALLVGTFPLDSGRRHVAPGAGTDELVRQAARAYADLLAQIAAEPAGDDPRDNDPRVKEPWRLVPTGLPAGVLDGALRGSLLELLPGTPMLRSAEDPSVVLRPRDAVALEPPAGADADAVDALAPVVAGLVPAPHAAAAAFDLLGVRRLALADIVEALPAPTVVAGWIRLLAGLAGLADDPLAREALAALPVPLAGGHVARGARGVVLPPPDPGTGTALAALGVRAVDPAVAADVRTRRLLERLGATGVSGRAALDLPAVTTAVAALADGDDAADEDAVDEGPEQARLDAVLTLVAAAVRDGGLASGDLPWLGVLPLPDAEGSLAPAAELVLPDSPAARLLDPDAVGLVDAGLVERWGAPALRAVGVLDGLALLRAADVPLDEPPDRALEQLDDVGGWLDALRDLADAALGSPLGAVIADVVAVRDLDAVRDDAWPDILAAFARDPGLRSALLTPARIVAPSSGAAPAPSYTAWWLREHLADGGVWADPDAPDALAALLPEPPPGLADADPAVRAALGAVADVGELDAGAVADVLDGLADAQVEVDLATALRVWAALATVLAASAPDVAGTPPPVVRVLGAEARTQVVDAGEACVVGDAMYLQRSDLAPFVVAPDAEGAAALAAALDLPLAADLAPGAVEETGRPVAVPGGVAALLPDVATTWCEHDRLIVDGVEVDWWVDSGGLVHASTLDGLARGLASEAGAWSARSALAEVLLDPGALPRLLLDEAFSRVRAV
jgi:hypothetical protein